MPWRRPGADRLRPVVVGKTGLQDGQAAGRQNSLGTPHIYALQLTPGTHTLTIRVDNRVKDFNVGANSHSISDHTQGNWNGMIGRLCLRARSPLHIGDAALFPSVEKKQVRSYITVINPGHRTGKARLRLQATRLGADAGLPAVEKEISVKGDSVTVEVDYSMGASPALWDEFNPNLYVLHVSLQGPGEEKDQWQQQFGMRTFATQGTQFTINGQRYSTQFRAIHVYINTPRGWHVVSGQATNLPPGVQQPL